MGAGELPSATGRWRAGAHWPTAKSLPSSRVEQVAAVCYRVRGTGIEFLLVRTRKGRWTFPKGGAESGLTHAQAAALEAFEEAGVHGRIEEVSFARYRRGKQGKVQANAEESATGGTVVHAYLCEVLRLGPPQEFNRNRTWFSPERAKWQLRESRSSENGADIARIVDRAVVRIQRLRRMAGVATDALQKVRFEATDVSRMEKALFFQHLGRKRGGKEDSAAIEFAVNAYLREILRLTPGQPINKRSALLTAGKASWRLERNPAPDHLARTPRVVEGTSATVGGEQSRKVIRINKPQKRSRMIEM
jgi:8-oxo-dGTP pyrophosphatase MutT (NUDIX family)